MSFKFSRKRRGGSRALAPARTARSPGSAAEITMAWARARSTGRQGSPSRSASGRHAPWGLWKCAAPELCPADGTSPAPTYSRPCGLAGGRRGCGKNRNELKKRSSVSTHGLRKNSQSRKLHLVTADARGRFVACSCVARRATPCEKRVCHLLQVRHERDT